MSVSSGSDVTIPIQDSPPPPPSPYGNRNQESERKTPEPRGDVGIDNAAFEPSENDDKDGSKGKVTVAEPSKKANHTQIHINGPELPLLNEALNSELINMNIMNTIPDKPQTEFGPYENPDEYFIAVNQHKKFLRRSEKLYVTKDKRKVNSWKKYICWLIGAFILASVVTIAVLAGLGLISQKTPPSSFTDSVLGTTTSSELISSSSSSSSVSPNVAAGSTEGAEDDSFPRSSSSLESSTSTSSVPQLPTRAPLSDTHVPSAADITLTLDNMEYTAALNNKSSDRFRELSASVEQEMQRALTQEAGLTTAYAKVMEFLPGSVVAKMRLSWMDDRKELMDVQMFVSTLRQLGPYEIRPGATSFYGLVNHCKFRNYDCSHYCTFDYEQLDFLCTCPELLRLAEDQKTCIENVPQLSSSTAADEDIIPYATTANDTDTPLTQEEEPHHQHHGPDGHEQDEDDKVPTVTEPPFMVQTISTEGYDPISQTSSTSPPPPSVLTADSEHEIEDSPSQSYPSSSSPSPPLMENQGESTGEDLAPNFISSTEAGEIGEEHQSANDTSAGGVLPEPEISQPNNSDGDQVTSQPGADAADGRIHNSEESQDPPPHLPLLETTSESPAEDRALNEARDGLHLNRSMEIHHADGDNVDAGTPIIPTVMPRSGSQGNASDEESSIGAPLQRAESDNYSEVEQHQEIRMTLNTTTTAAPILSFNTSRYSEERNILLSQGSAQSEEVGLTESSVESDQHGSSSSTTSTPPSAQEHGLHIENGSQQGLNGTRHKSARLESYGEEPLSRQLGTNSTARSLLTNSAEFMIYGDNVVSPNPDRAGTDSGLVEDSPQTPLSGLQQQMNRSTETSEELSSLNSNEGSASVEAASAESSNAESNGNNALTESASVQAESEEKAGIVFSGALTTVSPPPTSEDYTTVPPFDLENDTLVNENATEDRVNWEPVIIEGPKGEEEVAVETTPFTPEETPQEVSEPSVNNTTIVSQNDAPVNKVTPEISSTMAAVPEEKPAPPAPEEVPSGNGTIVEAPFGRDSVEEGPATTLAPIEETTLIMDEPETTVLPSVFQESTGNSPAPGSSRAEETVMEGIEEDTTTIVPASSADGPAPAIPSATNNTTAAVDSVKESDQPAEPEAITEQPATPSLENNQTHINPSVSSSSNSSDSNINTANNRDTTGTSDNENELS